MKLIHSLIGLFITKMFGYFLVLTVIISKVKCQFFPVTVSCPQANVPSALSSIYAKVGALPNPTLSMAPSARAAPSPWAILDSEMFAGSNQQLVCPVEYTVVSPTALSLPLSSAPTAPATCCPPTSIPSLCPSETIVQDYLELRWPEALFDLPLGYLDPILSTYGTITEIPIAATSPVSSFAPPVSPLLPSLLPSETSCHFLKKISIPPPFI